MICIVNKRFKEIGKLPDTYIPENKENKIENEHELSKLTTAPPKDTAAFDNNNVFAKVNSQGSGTYNPSPGHIP